MQKIKTNKTQYLAFGGVLFVFFILVFVLNKLYPLYADDWGYIYHGQSFGEASVSICEKLYNQYFTWGGRMVVHAIAHLLSWIGLGLSDLVNSFAFVFYIYVVYRISNKGNSINPMLLLLLGIFLWLIIPAFNSTVLWLVGAANYMWGALIVTLFLSVYYFYYIGAWRKISPLYVVLFFIAGIVSGWTNENLFAAQVFFIVCVFFLLRRDNISIPVWMVSGLVGVCIGGLLMIAAPGNYIRSQVVVEGLGLADKSIIEQILYRVMKVGYRYVVYVLPVVIVYFIVFRFYRKQNASVKGNKTLCGSLLFFASGNVACFAMMASYIFPPRAIFGIITFIAIAIGILYANLKMDIANRKRVRIIVLSVLLILFIANYGFDYKNIHYLSDEFAKREQYMNEQKQLGNRNITFEGEIALPSKYDFEDLSDEASHWLNLGYSKYYGIDSVRVLKK